MKISLSHSSSLGVVALGLKLKKKINSEEFDPWLKFVKQS